MVKNRAILSNPSWINDELQKWPKYAENEEQMMSLAIALSKRNVLEKTGGPFGAAIFEKTTGKLISVGANSVLRTATSVAHAEIMAIILAQHRLKCHSLYKSRNNNLIAERILATSAQPCSQCTHAIWWSGISRILIGARTSDVESIANFDEGVGLENIEDIFAKKKFPPHVTIKRDLFREEACEVLYLYKKMGGENY